METREEYAIDEPWRYVDSVLIPTTNLEMDLFHCPFCEAINSAPDDLAHNPDCIWSSRPLPRHIQELYDYAKYLERVDPPCTDRESAWRDLKLALDKPTEMLYDRSIVEKAQ